MASLLTVCTGNICRSPLAEMLLESQLAAIGITVASVGTHAESGARMPRSAVALATKLGIRRDRAERHRAHTLDTVEIESAALILTMSREHRRFIADLCPEARTKTFTLNEFVRLTRGSFVDDLSIALPTESAARARIVRHERLVALAERVAGQRGRVHPPSSPVDDDIVDPYRRSWLVYRRSGASIQAATAHAATTIQRAFAAEAPTTT